MLHIDLNCDLGEGGKVDQQLMPLISSCNIACGGHYGNVQTITETVNLALKHQVNIGAHPSYEDKINFGRHSMDISFKELKQILQEQITTVKKITEKRGGKLHHVKPHGALYNDCVHDKEKTKAVIEAITEIDKNIILFVPPNSELRKQAKGVLKTWTEGFADRNYTEEFTLVSRKKANAVLHNKEEVFTHLFLMISEGKIKTEKTTFLQANFDTFCVHSDTQNSVKILQYLKEKLTAENIKIK